MYTKLTTILFVLCTTAFVALATNQPVGAVTASDWRAGNIIDDGIFTNESAMSVSQIQAWLDARLKNCDYWGTQPSEFGGGTRAQYGAAHGNPAPFTCLNRYYEVPKTTKGNYIPANNYGKSTRPAGSKSAAQLIYDAAQAYNISPKVLLVKLGTESAGPLTSDLWPFHKQYTYAMGAHCPDSGPGGSANCDINYSGFSIQMREAAKLMRDYLDGMDQPWWGCTENGKKVQCPWNRSNGSDPGGGNKVPGATNYILWNVRPSGCGGKNIFIENKATAALYNYTPYQPNAAALNNMYGTGNGCSAYGNRNFWRVFNDWFGSSTVPAIFKTPQSSRAYMRSDDKYFYIPSPQVLYAYGFDKSDIRTISSRAAGTLEYAGTLSTVARFEGTDPVYFIEGGRRHHFTSRESLQAYGYELGNESNLESNLLETLPEKEPMSNILRFAGKPEVYLVENAKKRHITSPEAYKNLGSPTYASRPDVTMTSRNNLELGTGAPILANNVVVKNSQTNAYYLWDGTQLRSIDARVAAAAKIPVHYATGTAALSQLSTGGTSIGKLVKSSSGALFILDSAQRISVSSGVLAELGLTSSQFITVPDSFLSNIPTVTPLRQTFRVNSSDKVYLVDNGERIHVHSRKAMEQNGFNFDEVINVNSSTAALFPDSQKKLLALNSLYRINSGDAVYMVTGLTSSLHVRSPAVLYAYGYNFDMVYNLSSQAVAGYASSAQLGHLVKTSDDTVWVIDSDGQKRNIPSNLLGSASYNVNMSSVPTVDSRILTDYTTKSNMTTLLMAEGTDPVYKIENGTKRWITSREAFQSVGGSYEEVVTVSSSFLGTIPRGSNIN